MALQGGGERSKPPQRPKGDARSLKRKRDVDDHEKIQRAVEELDLKADFKSFSDLPLSQNTAQGLEQSHYKNLTDIQSKAIALALKGRDILGAAKTGSGKTLAFLVPVLENLHRQQWTKEDGLGALIISPTRELASQIFKVLRQIGGKHDFSSARVVGAEDFGFEQARLKGMNIIIATPGRLLAHLDKTPGFEVGNLQMLVLDEADRIMDMGFQGDVDAILEHLPKERQTMLFSATQAKKVSDLARLSLRDPEYVAVHEAAVSATPTSLQQFYVVCGLPEKLNTLYGFLKEPETLKSKIIVFLSSTKQVRFVFEAFRHLQPGIPLMHLYGGQKQTTRQETTAKFSAAKRACMFATDVVARGIDFPAVDWVFQLDCPEDADTYIHRVGRTARNERAGRAILLLAPNEEEGMLKRLEHKKVPIRVTKTKERKRQDIKNKLQNMCFQYPELKHTAQSAFTNYAKSIQVQKDKEIFDVQKYDWEGFAASMGLPGTPKIKFLKGNDAKKLKNTPRAGFSSDEDSEIGDGDKQPKKEAVRTKYDRMFERRNQDVLSSHYAKMVADDGGEDATADADEDNDFLSVKRVLPIDESSSDEEESVAAAGTAARIISGIGKEPLVIDSKRREKLLKSKKNLTKLKEKGTKMVYDDDGVAHPVYELEDEEDFQRRGPAAAQREKFLQEEAERVRQADLDDKELAKLKKRRKQEKRKERELAALSGLDNAGPEPSEAGDGEDPLALLASLPLPEDDEGARPTKRPKKWFEDDSDDEKKLARKRKGRVIEAADEPETLEDLEALAAGLLD